MESGSCVFTASLPSLPDLRTRRSKKDKFQALADTLQADSNSYSGIDIDVNLDGCRTHYVECSLRILWLAKAPVNSIHLQWQKWWNPARCSKMWFQISIHCCWENLTNCSWTSLNQNCYYISVWTSTMFISCSDQTSSEHIEFSYYVQDNNNLNL